MTRDWSPEPAARWLAEAVETGNPLAPLPAEIAPPDQEGAEAVGFAVLAQLELVPCGVRLLFRPGQPPLRGPMLEGRLVPPDAPIALGALRHPRLSAAVLGVLAAPLLPEDVGPPIFAALHPAIDIAAGRFAEASGDARVQAADLACLGLVVAGRGKSLAPGVVPVSLAAEGARRRPLRQDLAQALAEAAVFARQQGGLPAGALLVVAGLSPPLAGPGAYSAAMGPLGRVALRAV